MSLEYIDRCLDVECSRFYTCTLVQQDIFCFGCSLTRNKCSGIAKRCKRKPRCWNKFFHNIWLDTLHWRKMRSPAGDTTAPTWFETRLKLKRGNARFLNLMMRYNVENSLIDLSAFCRWHSCKNFFGSNWWNKLMWRHASIWFITNENQKIQAIVIVPATPKKSIGKVIGSLLDGKYFATSWGTGTGRNLIKDFLQIDTNCHTWVRIAYRDWKQTHLNIFFKRLCQLLQFES